MTRQAKTAPDRPAGPGETIGFKLWLWTMLAVIALSAAPTGGQPRTKAIGSAFDPATISVALTSQRQSGQPTVAARRNDDNPPSPSTSLDAVQLTAAISPVASISSSRPAITNRPEALVAALAVHPLSRSLAPRGPPAS